MNHNTCFKILLQHVFPEDLTRAQYKSLKCNEGKRAWWSALQNFILNIFNSPGFMHKRVLSPYYPTKNWEMRSNLSYICVRVIHSYKPTTATFATYLILQTTIILMEVKKPKELHKPLFLVV